MRSVGIACRDGLRANGIARRIGAAGGGGTRKHARRLVVLEARDRRRVGRSCAAVSNGLIVRLDGECYFIDGQRARAALRDGVVGVTEPGHRNGVRARIPIIIPCRSRIGASIRRCAEVIAPVFAAARNGIGVAWSRRTVIDGLIIRLTGDGTLIGGDLTVCIAEGIIRSAATRNGHGVTGRIVGTTRCIRSARRRRAVARCTGRGFAVDKSGDRHAERRLSVTIGDGVATPRSGESHFADRFRPSGGAVVEAEVARSSGSIDVDQRIIADERPAGGIAGDELDRISPRPLIGGDGGARGGDLRAVTPLPARGIQVVGRAVIHLHRRIIVEVDVGFNAAAVVVLITAGAVHRLADLARAPVHPIICGIIRRGAAGHVECRRRLTAAISGVIIAGIPIVGPAAGTRRRSAIAGLGHDLHRPFALVHGLIVTALNIKLKFAVAGAETRTVAIVQIQAIPHIAEGVRDRAAARADRFVIAEAGVQGMRTVRDVHRKVRLLGRPGRRTGLDLYALRLIVVVHRDVTHVESRSVFPTDQKAERNLRRTV